MNKLSGSGKAMPKSQCSKLFATAAFLIAGLLPASGAEWRRYTNARFGMSEEYPTYLVEGGSATDLNDGAPGAALRLPTGISLSSGVGIEVSIYGMTARATPYAEMCATSCEGQTYAVKRPNWAVVSGRQGSAVFYRRCQRGQSDRSLHCFSLE